MQQLPFGTWPSPISPDDLASGSVGLDEVRVDGPSTYWLEGRPTEAGRQALVEWVSGEAQMPELRDESLLKLFFSDAVPREQALEQLRMRRAGHEEFLAFLRRVEAETTGKHPLANLVLEYGIDYAEFNIEWCKRQERRLGAKEAA